MSIRRYLDKTESLKGKEILVTGATSGIGLSLARHILHKEGTLVILARNLKKADGIKKQLLEEYPDSSIDILRYDQSDKKVIDEAVNNIREKYPNFYALVLNAGVLCPEEKESREDGYTLTYFTNFIGLDYFIKQLRPYLKQNQRLIMQGSFVANTRKIKAKVDYKDAKTPLFKQYVISKSAVESLFYSYTIGNQFPSQIYLTEPGLTKTNIVRDLNPVVRVLGKAFLATVSHSSRKAALTIIKALQSTTPNKSYIIPRGLKTYMGYPKIKTFPNKRKRLYLLDY